MTHPLDLAVLIAYVATLLGLTLFVRRAKNIEDFSVASRDLPSPIIFATLAATYIGPGYSIGLADKAADKGYVWFFIFSAFCLQTLLVGRFIAPRLQTFHHARTVGGILGRQYGRLTQVVAGILTIAVLTGFVGVMAKASGGIISELTGIPMLWASALSATVVIGYSTFGGMKADVMNDVFQFIILSLAIPLLLLFTLYYKGTAQLDLGAARLPGISAAMPPLTAFGLVVSFFAGEMLIPPYTVRALAARSPVDAQRGFTLAAVFGLAWFFVCASIGVAHADLDSSQGVVMYAMRQYLPHGLFAFVLVSLVAIILSSWDSLLNCASSSLQADILECLRTTKSPHSPSIAATRLLNVMIGIAATLFAVSVPSLIDALLYCYTLWAPTIVPLLVIAAFRVNVHPLAGLAGILFGALSAGIWEWALGQPAGIPSLVVGLLGNQVAFWGVHLLARSSKPPQWLLYSATDQQAG